MGDKRKQPSTTSDNPGGPTQAETDIDNVVALCDRWMGSGIVWWRRRAAAEIMDMLTAEPDPTRDLLLVDMRAENNEAVIDVAAGGPHSHAALLATVAAMGNLLHEKNPPNYVEFEVVTSEHTYIAHVRTDDKPSPHTLRQQAEDRIALARCILETEGDPSKRLERALRILAEDGPQ